MTRPSLPLYPQGALIKTSLTLHPQPDSSIFNTAIAKKLPAYIANAVVPLGLPLSSLGAFITALSANDQAALMKVPGISPQIIGAGAHGLQEAYAKSLQGVWICAAVLSAVAALCEFPL